jgi:hypothetical protein
MTINNLKQILYERFTLYWQGAEVAWGNTDKVEPELPLVLMRPGIVTRSSQPVTKMKNGIVFNAYPSEVSVQIDLFTQGKAVSIPGKDNHYENTALNDLIDFINYLDSVSALEWSDENDISISLLNGAQDLSEVVNDSQWQYRAMAEINVSFTQWTAEYNGILSETSIIFDGAGNPVGVNSENWKPTASGGGSQELADESTGFFEEAEITYEQEEEI